MYPMVNVVYKGVYTMEAVVCRRVYPWYPGKCIQNWGVDRERPVYFLLYQIRLTKLNFSNLFKLGRGSM